MYAIRSYYGAVLIIMKDRDVHNFFQLFFNVKTFGSLDVLEIDAAESRFQQFDGANDFIAILGVQFDIEYVNVGKPLE